jgi:hypothetical protein
MRFRNIPAAQGLEETGPIDSFWRAYEVPQHPGQRLSVH